MTSFDAAMLILRVGVGLVILAHGVNHARGREKTTNWFGGMGFRQAGLQWFFSTTVEIGVGVFLIVGLLNSLAATGLVSVMFVAWWSVHRNNGFFIFRPGEGWEYVATLGLTGVVMAIAGPGEISIDNALGIAQDLDGWVGAALVAGGLVLAAGQLAMFFRPSEATDT
ncbi:MAG: DoxX family protein [Actinobacteria bacterium]|nr:DoxX family protein [Actinomycetota bacterium]